MKQLVLASGNAGKLAEFNRLLAQTGIEVVSQASLGVDDAEETGLSFVENALLKARHASRLTGLPALADDSGLCVDALGGAPGLYSARYAGSHGDHAANIAKLLAELDGLPIEQRAAHFHCTPHLTVWVDEHVQVPMAYVKNNEIVLNIGANATHKLLIDNEYVSFSARFSGVSHDIWVPVGNVMAIFARETGEGMGFEVELQHRPAEEDAAEAEVLALQPVASSAPPADEPLPRPAGGGGGRPSLKIVK